jgi:hypothetical protein
MAASARLARILRLSASVPAPSAASSLPALLQRIDDQLLPALRLHSADPHDPVHVLAIPDPWRPLGCGNYAAVLHRGRGLIVDISDFLNPEPCRAWQDLRWAYHVFYRPLIAPLGLRAPAPLLDGVRR